MHVDDNYNKLNNNSDVGAFAIHKLLRHSMIKGEGIWHGAAACVYILGPNEAMSREEGEEEAESRRKTEREIEQMHSSAERPPATAESLRIQQEKNQRQDNYARLDANQFLRNGFFQDKAVAKDRDPYIIVAGRNSWNQPLKSHSEVAAVQFWDSSSGVRPPVGKDAEILDLTKRKCRPGGGGTVSGEARASSYRAEVLRLMNEGGSLARAHALHAACAIDDYPMPSV